MGFRNLGVLGLPVAALAALMATATSAQASAGTGVSLTPSAVMPYVTSANSNVTQIVQCGPTMYAVGTFSQIGKGPLRYDRRNAFSFNATTGAVSRWDPRPNGEVTSIATSANCASVYLAGSFTTVAGRPRPYLAKVGRSGTGTVDAAFAPAADKAVAAVAVQGPRLIVGGRFTSIGGAPRSRLASLDQATGAATGYLRLAVTGRISGLSGGTQIHKLRLSPDGTRLLATGVFDHVAGQARSQIFMVDLKPAGATMDAWYAPALNLPCTARVPFYVRAATWSPDNSRVYLATTGYRGKSPLCDVAAAFSSSSSSTQTPLWINAAGCDSLYAVAADAKTVYFGGHERYIDNAAGCDAKGAGALDRPGVGAVSAGDGRSLAWNPTRSRGHGADDMLRTPAGLWIASDTYLNSTSCGHKYHPGICFFPNG